MFRFLSKLDKKRGNAIRKSGEANNMEYWSGQAETRYPSSSLLGARKSFVPHGLLSSGAVDLGEAHFTKSSRDKDVTIAYNFTVVRLGKDTGLHILIDSKHNNVLGRSLLDTSGVKEGMEKISLEGNFPDNYDIYQIQGGQINTLQLLNPLAMQELVDSFRVYDFEIINDRVYLYQLYSNDLKDPAKVKARLEDGERIKLFMQRHAPYRQS